MEANPPIINTPKPNHKKIIILGVIFLGLLILSILSFMLYSKYKPSNLGENKKSLFKTTLAIFEGQILSIQGDNLTVRSTDGVTGEIESSKNLVITNLSKPKTNTDSYSIKDLELNKDVRITLTQVDNKFKATSVSYQALVPEVSIRGVGQNVPTTQSVDPQKVVVPKPVSVPSPPAVATAPPIATSSGSR